MSSSHVIRASRRIPRLLVWTTALVPWVVVASAVAQVAPASADDGRVSADDRVPAVAATETPSAGEPVGQIHLYPAAADQGFRRVRSRPGTTVSPDAVPIAPAGTAERLAYSNTLAKNWVELPANALFADDLTLTAPDGCSLRRYRFRVTGKANPNACGGEGASCGPFTTTYALYDFCPGAGGAPIAGTEGTFVSENDGAYEIEVVIPAKDAITLPSRVWLGVAFNRQHAGVLMGSLPLVGWSDDVVDALWSPCNSRFGGFPQYPHSSFFAEVYADADCPLAFPGYVNIRSANAGINAGGNNCIADDITPAGACDLIGMEVAVRGQGFFDVELRGGEDGAPAGDCSGGVESMDRYAIPGTHRRFLHATADLSIERFTFDPPIALPDEGIFAVLVPNNINATWVLTGRDASLGSTGANYYEWDESHWAATTPTNYHGGMQVTITCAGEPPRGACCDMYQTDAFGEAVCRDVPRMNCAFPWNGSLLRPDWMEGETCANDPFPMPCGVSACCEPDDTCENLTQNECNAIEPVDAPRVWMVGQYCGEGGQRCPIAACLRDATQNECLLTNDGPGCWNPYCCTDVCRADPWCCEVAWDRDCVRLATTFPDCDDVRNDECYAPHKVAWEVAARSSTFFTNINATKASTDPIASCRLRMNGLCQGGWNHGRYCQEPADCPEGTCEPTLFGPDRPEHSVWFKFVATYASAEISLCQSEDDIDTILQVFSAGDPTSNASACATLAPIACNDDGGGCAFGSHQARLCVQDLVPGETYYVLVGGRTVYDEGMLQLDIQSPCPPPLSLVANDRCDKAIDATLGTTPFQLDGATPPIAELAPDALKGNDVWYRLHLSEPERIKIDTCAPDVDGFADASIEVYLEDYCGYGLMKPFLQARAADSDCARGASLEMDAWVPYGGGDMAVMLIRLVDESGAGGVGDLNIERVGDVRCFPWDTSFVSDSPFSLSGTVDAQRPFPEHDPSRLEGLDDLYFSPGVATIDLRCVIYEETNVNPSLHPPYSDDMAQNEILGIEWADGGFRMHLKRPITPGELTRITYRDALQQDRSMCLLSLPGDVDASGAVNGRDILALIDWLNTGHRTSTFPNWWAQSDDINRDGKGNATDILELIDLLNGAGSFARWYGATVPLDAFECPTRQ